MADRIDELASRVDASERLGAAEALELYRHAPTHVLGGLADRIRARRHSDGIVTYIIDRNVNYTNVCVARCNFCAFYRNVGSVEGYVLGFDEDLEGSAKRSRSAASSSSCRRPIQTSRSRGGSFRSVKSAIRHSAYTPCRRLKSFTSHASRRFRFLR